MCADLAIDARMWWLSGIGVYLRNVTRRFSRRLTTFTLIIPSNSVEEPTGGWLIRKAGSGIYTIKEQFEIAWLAVDFDTLWVPHYNAPVVRSRRMIVTVHDCAHLALPAIFGSPLMRVYAWIMYYGVMSSAYRVICVSQFTASELRRFIPFGWHKIVVVPNGVDEKWFSIARLDQPKKRFLLFVGNLKPHKNVEALIEAFNASASCRDMELLLVGNYENLRTSLRMEVVAQLAELGRVRILGKVSDKKLEELYSTATALVVPSTYEGFGLPLLEGMALGCPVIATRIQPFEEVAGQFSYEQCREGCLVFSNDQSSKAIALAIDRFMALSDEQLAEMTANGRRRARLFSWQAAVAQVEGVLCEDVVTI